MVPSISFRLVTGPVRWYLWSMEAKQIAVNRMNLSQISEEIFRTLVSPAKTTKEQLFRMEELAKREFELLDSRRTTWMN